LLFDLNKLQIKEQYFMK